MSKNTFTHHLTHFNYVLTKDYNKEAQKNTKRGFCEVTHKSPMEQIFST